ncbi:MAG: hypothetical protein HEQ19_13985 [Gloeotrichia echinulata CP02]|jgi:hypothetical protein|nr:hypothetical protein [Gloeotrichia echinulata DEX184]
MGRYGDIRRGKELNEALAKLRAYEDKPKDQKQAAYKQQRGNSIKVSAIKEAGYVESFGLAGRIFLPVRILADNQSGSTGNAQDLITLCRNSAASDSRTRKKSEALPSGSTPLDGLKGYRPARLILVEKGSLNPDNKSRITGIQYTRYFTKSVSSPFGAKSETEKYQEAVSDIRELSGIKSFLTGSDSQGNRISFIPEIL